MNAECAKCGLLDSTVKENLITCYMGSDHKFDPLPHTHGEHGSHTEVDVRWSEKHSEPIKILQLICLDDGVIYKELEITREVK